MLTILYGTDWIANRDAVLDRIATDVSQNKGNRVLIVPELISHDTERRLCAVAGDSACRFAEVLTFTRLYRRVSDCVGHAAVECLDNGGRIIAMASSARQLHSRLKAYASVETRPEFLSGLVDAVDEFKRCCITPQDLKAASEQTQGSLAQKLEELSLLLETYESHCTRGKRDPRDQMTWLLEQLEDSDFGQEHVFYIDGFPDFTRQHMAILEHLIQTSAHVVVSLNCDRPVSDLLAFEKAGNTALELIRSAQRMGIPVVYEQVSARSGCLHQVRRQLFQGSVSALREGGKSLRLFRNESVYEECASVAQQVIELIQQGVRYRDIGVTCTDMNVYRAALRMIFRRCGIPMYHSGTEDILDRPIITTVLAAMDAALGGFEQKDVLRYLKSVLSPLSLEEADMMENYVILWSISAKQWITPWTKHPDGLGEDWTDSAREKLEELNRCRELVVQPLIRLYDGFRDAINLRQQVDALYVFLGDMDLCQRLDRLAAEFDSVGDGQSAQILGQLWEILLSALEQMYDVLGDTVWDAQTFTRLLRLLLSQYDVGTIPPVLDCVTVGPVSFMRCHQTKHMFVLGAVEGSFPGYSGSTGVLTEQERKQLRTLGVPLTGGAVEGLQAEFGEIYGVFCAAEESVTVSYPGGQPSFIYHRLLAMASTENSGDGTLASALSDAAEAGAYLARFDDVQAAEQLGVRSHFDEIADRKTYRLGNMDASTVRSLYGDFLRLSASQVDLQADCRLAYFLKYGLRVKERKPATVDPAEFGTYVHAVLEETAKEIMDLGGFAQVTLEQTLEIARKYSWEYAAQRFKDLDSDRLTYIFRRNGHELEMIVQELWQELHVSCFAPVDFEVGFGVGEKMPPIDISGEDMHAVLRGFVDRVDAWQEDGRNYFRVVDYKTGRKDFDYCDVFNGLGLQMLLYLFALQQEGQIILGEHPVPAGVQYFPARAPLVSADSLLTDEEAALERESIWKRRGLLLSDEAVLRAMEPGDKPRRMNYTRKKDDSISGDVASREQFRMLHDYVFRLLSCMVDDIASGNVDANPYTRGSSHNACTFCPYGAVCHPDTVEGRRNYKAMSAQRFWEEVGKEVGHNG